MEVTDDGMLTDISPVQPEKAILPMEVTDDGIFTDVSPVQPENAAEPMEVTVDGMLTDVSFSEFLNEPTSVTV
jgi:hypothetical protein